ncbi:iron ABC transporter ATP-binding protein [Leuconostoc carnosum]|uniref:iron ABC transporter ATP-binding protein n=1 Tax=Leuconostoc carnosum TaxID=1252 RepID=UPI00345D507F
MKIEGLSTSFGKKTILENIDLTIKKGKLTAFIGPNGAGKTTLLTTMSRLIATEIGHIYLNGQDLKSFKSRQLAQQLSILKQMNHLNMNITVSELVAFARFPYSRGNLTLDDKDKINLSIDQLGLSDLAETNIQTLSGGQLQRAYIAMILAQDTEYILLDEPLNNLDMNFAVQMLHLLQKLVTEFGKTVIIVLHDINFAASFADEIVAMKSGKIFAHNQTDDIIHEDILNPLYDMSVHIKNIDGKKICLYF